MKSVLTFLLFIAALGTLLSLGYWQVQRLAWKTEIIEQLESEYAKDPLQNRLAFKDLTTDRIQYGSVRGRFDYSKEILVGPKPHDGKIGYLVITPLQLTGGNIFVNRGWIENNKEGNAKPRSNVRVTGIFRKPDWNRFTPENSPENDVWTKLDLEQIAEAKNVLNPAPVLLYAESASKSFGALAMQKQQWFPRNKHKQYAIFWFSMAGILCVIFGLFCLQQKRKPS